MRELELLAPAKNLACGMAAISHGADAVYIGASKFGARAAAGNSLEDIAELCVYAHQYGAKVYVT
ncbi:MAG: collagenase-like protease, partial [Prevotella sp.]|nr:collagenase-like protease [Prevotella sp.]